MYCYIMPVLSNDWNFLTDDMKKAAKRGFLICFNKLSEKLQKLLETIKKIKMYNFFSPRNEI